jgi:ATP-dependent DNA helicase DinG
MARAQTSLRERPGQLAMARAVAQVLEEGGSLAVEAGTGVGKTYAYLVPLLLSGKRALLSTATQALQDQLFHRDIPAVIAAMGLPVRVALLKGRSSYLCLHRLAVSQQAGPASRDPRQGAALQRLQRWAAVTRTGDLAEVPGLDERSPWHRLVTSTRENCLGSACAQAATCHVNQAREQAMQADWVVINHHVFMADLELRETGVASLLPQAEVVVFDEAHHLNDAAQGFLGRRVSSGRLRALASDLATQAPLLTPGWRPWSALALGIEQAARAIAQAGQGAHGADGRVPWRAGVPDGLEAQRWHPLALGLDQALGAAEEALSAIAEHAPVLERLLARSQALRRDWRALAGEAAAPGFVRWMTWEGGRQWAAAATPVNSAALFAERLQDQQEARHWVFTSATLGHDGTLSWFTRSVGLHTWSGLRTLRVPSAFDHARQAAVYVPSDLPDPADAEHTPALAAKVAEWATQLQGRTLVLTTTLRAVRRMAEALALGDGVRPTLRVLAQGSASRRQLLDRFRDPDGGPSVLIASASFWEGVDLPGDALQLLVIDKLPFAPPDDPVVNGRLEMAASRGENAFVAVTLADAAMALKQGAGRLIRSETDRGVLVIGDRRLLSRSYGPSLLAALPPMRCLEDEAAMAAELSDLVLTRPSTTARLFS